jgi:NifU-like protein
MWDYNDKVMDHFLHPRNVGEVKDADGVGQVGNMSCGDALKLSFKLDKDGRICEAKFQTFGCASAIASSSALTEMIQGMTLDEAEKLSNKDIVDVLGDLPEAKLHCSVMGMEALQAAIANYRGEESGAAHEDNHEGRIVCKCFSVTDTKIRNTALNNDLHTVEEITDYCKAGGACGSCLEEIQDILDGIWKEKKTESTSSKRTEFMSMPLIQRVLKVQEIIDSEVKPMLEQDGGGIDLIDMKDNVVYVKLTGHCASCPSAGITLKSGVEAVLKDCLFPEIVVENV